MIVFGNGLDAGGNMHYIINHTIIYDPDNALIRIAEHPENDEIALTPIANSILKHLINFQGHVISKDNLIELISEDTGRRVSGNTIVQYMSNLRKIFKDTLPDVEIIVTVPGQGYLLSEEPAISAEDTAGMTDNIPPPSPDITAARAPEGNINKRVFAVIFLLSAAIVAVTMLYSTLIRKYTYPVQTTNLLRHYDGCPVYILHYLLSEERRDLYDRRFTDIVTRHNVSCTQNASFYMSMNRGAEDGVSGNVMLAKCTENTHGPNACVNYQYSRW